MLATLFFFVIVVSLYPLGIGPEVQLLRRIAPGVVWVAALLASMLSLGRLFGNDYQDGSLEQLLLTPQPVYLLVVGKVFAHWLLSEIPLVVIAPREYAGNYRGVALAGDSGSQSDWFHRRGVDPGIAERERPGGDTGPAALRSRAHLRSRRD